MAYDGISIRDALTEVTAALAWVPVAAVWLLAVPRAAKARAWHRWHALVPLVPTVLYALIAAGCCGTVDFQSWAWLPVWFGMGAGMLIMLTATWVWGSVIRNHGTMDIVYPLLPLAGAITAAVLSERPVSLATGLLLALVAVWAVRLSVQTYGHNIPAEREPYATWRRRHGAEWRWWSFFQIYLLQGVMIWLWSISFAFAFTATSASSWMAAAGTLVWLAGLTLQAGADVQLARFKRDPRNKGRLMREGMWSVVRHPNYLGESVIWWAYFIFALGHSWGALAVISPLYVTWFMGYGSAAPFKERHMSRTRPVDWADYAARTPRFFPWPRPRV